MEPAMKAALIGIVGIGVALVFVVLWWLDARRSDKVHDDPERLDTDTTEQHGPTAGDLDPESPQSARGSHGKRARRRAG